MSEVGPAGFELATGPIQAQFRLGFELAPLRKSSPGLR